MSGWIAWDLDGVLAEYDSDEPYDIGHIGKPIPAMVGLLKQLLKEGKDCRIFTARVAHNNTRQEIEDANFATLIIMDWCAEHIGDVLPITNVKDRHMIRLYDDRSVQVIKNEGRLVWVDE